MKFDNKKYGAVPFWFWNGDQDEKEITRQLKLAVAGGVRGMAIHARKGNRTTYMSDRWIALVRHACMEARRLGLEIWLYDEEGCPSGTVGERLPARDKKYQQKALTFKYMTAGEASANTAIKGEFRSEEWGSPEKSFLPQGGEIIRAFMADDLSKSVNPAEIDRKTELLIFSKVFITDYIDALSRDTLEEFLNMTHRIYLERLGEFFGNPITAFYTDDLNHLLIYGNNIPFLSYTDMLEETFQKEHGYSILDKLPSLIENLSDSGKVRCDYRHTVMRMFLDNYVDPMRQWCKQNTLPLTGHLSGDEGTMLKSVCRFSAAMPFYEHEDIPGIDDFLTGMRENCYMSRAFNELGFSPVILCKQVSSVANQLKNGRCSSEVLTSLGWGVPVQQQMAQIRFQQGLGINLIVPHDFSYSTAGLTKRDHPASYFFQQPWYIENKELQEVISRSTQLLSRGLCAAKTAILHPVTSVWTTLDGQQLSPDFSNHHMAKLPDTDFIEKNFAELSLYLLQEHIDFEYIDEELLARHGSIDKNFLIMGNSRYETLILPPMINIKNTTLAFLRKFASEGGKIIQVGRSSTHLDGLEQNNIFDFPVTRLECYEALSHELTQLLDFIPIDGETKEVLLHTRNVDSHLEYFLTNFSSQSQTLQIFSDMRNHALYDPETDRIISNKKEFPEFFTLQPLATCHIVQKALLESLHENISETLFAVLSNKPSSKLNIKLNVSIKPENENVLMFDAGFLDNGSRILFSDSNDISAGTKINVPLNVPNPEKVFHIYAENPEKLNMTVNGKSLNWMSDAHHQSTQDLKKSSLKEVLHPGGNYIVFTTPGVRLEMFYLTGDFSVKLIEDETGCRAELTESSLTLGDLSKQGLPFFWGSLKYDIDFYLDKLPADCWMALGNVDGIIRTNVNGNDCGLQYKAPWRFNLKKLIKSGKNKIQITLYNTAQNFSGPHRAKNIFGPDRASEGSSNAAWTPELSGPYQDSWGIAPFGIHGPIKILSHKVEGENEK